MARRCQILIGSVVAVLIAVGSAGATLYWLACSFGPPEEMRDVGAYEGMLKGWAGTGLVAAFPARVPAEARGVRFVAFPGYLQGGAYIQLRMKLPAGEVAAIEERVKGETTHVYAGGGFFDHYCEDPKRNWPTTDFRTGEDAKAVAFPKGFVLYVLSAKDRSGGTWNHGETSGVAVSRGTEEVVYWADRW